MSAYSIWFTIPLAAPSPRYRVTALVENSRSTECEKSVEYSSLPWLLKNRLGLEVRL